MVSNSQRLGSGPRGRRRRRTARSARAGRAAARRAASSRRASCRRPASRARRRGGRPCTPRAPPETGRQRRAAEAMRTPGNTPWASQPTPLLGSRCVTPWSAGVRLAEQVEPKLHRRVPPPPGGRTLAAAAALVARDETQRRARRRCGVAVLPDLVPHARLQPKGEPLARIAEQPTGRLVDASWTCPRHGRSHQRRNGTE